MPLLTLLLACAHPGPSDTDPRDTAAADTADDTDPADTGDTDTADTAGLDTADTADLDTADSADLDTADADTSGSDTSPTDTADTADTAAPEAVVITVDVPSLWAEIAWLPDEDGDGRDELLVARSGATMWYCAAAGGAVPPPGVCYTCLTTGDLRVLRGRPGASFSLEADADRVLDGEECQGMSLTRADVDGDGVAEILAGSPLSERGYDGAWESGEVTVYAGAPPRDAPAVESALGGWVGDVDRDIGRNLAAAGDLDGDGREEVLTYASPEWVVLDGGAWSDAWPLAGEHAVEGLTADGTLAVGDIDGDGLADVGIARVLGGGLELSVWSGTTDSLDIHADDAALLVDVPGPFATYPDPEAAVLDANGDGYADLWAQMTESGASGNVLLGADGAAYAAGEVLSDADIVEVGSDGGTVYWSTPRGLGDGEDARLLASFHRYDAGGTVLSEGLLAFGAALLAPGATLVPEDAALLYDDAPDKLATGGDWNANGHPDVALAFGGDYVAVGSRASSRDQTVHVLLDP